MTHFNLNRMLQGCSAFIQTMAGDRAARNGAKRAKEYVLPLTCPLLASSLRLTCPLHLRRIALILCVLTMSVGQMWATDVYVWDGNTSETKLSKTSYTNDTDHEDGTTGFVFRLTGWKDALVDITGYTNYSTYGKSKGILQGGTTASSNNVKLVIPEGYTASVHVVYALTGNKPKYFGLNATTAVQPNGSNCSAWNVTVNSNTTLQDATINALTAGTYYLLGNAGNCVFAEIKVTLTASSARTYDGTEKMYFLRDAWSWWNNDGVKFFAYFWNSSTDEHAWSEAASWAVQTTSGNKDVWAYTVPAGTWTHVQITRHPSGTTTPTMSNRTNWSNDITLEATTNLLTNWTVMDQDNTGHSITWSNITLDGQKVYFDNRNYPDWTSAYVRIGHSSSNSAWGPMTLVAGTRNLYEYETDQWDYHTNFSVANSYGWTGSNNIYQPWEGQDWSAPAKITKQTTYQKYGIARDVYLCPTSTSMLERECQYYNVNGGTSTNTFEDVSTGVSLPSYTVTSSASHCTVTLQKCTNYESGTYTDLSSGGTVLPTQYVKVTVAPDAGYQFGSVAVTGVGTVTANAAGTPGVYYVTGDATITATCTAITHSVSAVTSTGDNSKGTVSAAATTVAETQTTTVTAVPATGYQVSNWAVSGTGSTISPSGASNATSTTLTMGTADAMVTVTFEAKSYIVTLNHQGGTNATNSLNVTYNATLSDDALFSTPTKTGYTFGGYYTEENGAGIQLIGENCKWNKSKTNYIDNNKKWIKADDVEIYAKWTPNTYSVTHTLDGVTATSGATGASAATYGTDYTAVFEATSGNTLPAAVTVTVGGSNVTANCTWDQGTGELTIPAAYVTGDIVITVTGVDDGTSFDITYNYNGGTGSPASDRGSSVDLPNPTRSGYVLQGWYTTDGTKLGDGGAEDVALTEDIVVYAKWYATCAAGGGGSTTVAAAAVNSSYDIAASIGTATKSGWSTSSSDQKNVNGEYANKLNSSGYVRLSPKTGSTFAAGDKLYVRIYNAKGETKNINVGVYNTSSEVVCVDAVSMSKDEIHEFEISLLSTYIHDGGYVEIRRGSSNGDGGWFVSARIVHSGSGGGGTCYHVTYDGNGAESGFVNDTASYASGDEVTVLGNGGRYPYVKSGYEIAGWADTKAKADAGTIDYAADATFEITADKTLYAVWRVENIALVTYTLNVGSSAGTTLKSSVDSGDDTNVPESNIDIDTSKSGISGSGANGGGSTTSEARSAAMSIKTGANGADWSGEPTNYVVFKYKVACGKKLIPSKVSMKVSNKGGSSKDNIKYKAVMSDGYGHTLTGTYVVGSQDGTVEEFAITNTNPDVYFQGNVTLKLWAWTIAEKSGGGDGFRMGTPVQIFGVIDDQATPTATITWTKQPAGGLSGTNETVTAVSSDGSTVTITSNNGSVATVAGSTVSYVGVGSTYLTASGTDACGNTMVSVNSDNFTVIGAYNLSYDANTGTGTMTGETGVHYAVVAENNFTAPSGKVFFGWNTAADGSGDSYQPGDAIELSANTTLYAQWGTELTATWSVTKVDSKLYRGGGGYNVTVYLNQDDWDESGNKDDLDLSATEGVTLKNIVKSINGESKAQVTADFDITTALAADATAITFTLDVPAAGAYGSAELTDDEVLDECSGGSGSTISIFDGTTATEKTDVDGTSYKEGVEHTDPQTGFKYTCKGVKKDLYTSSMSNSTGNGKTYSTGLRMGGNSSSSDNYIQLKVPTGYTANLYIVSGGGGGGSTLGVSKTAGTSTSYHEYANRTISSSGSYYLDEVTNLAAGTYYILGSSDKLVFGEITVTLTPAAGEGGVVTTLSWTPALESDGDWNSTESRLDKETGDADFTFTASTTSNTLGTITYSSSNTSVATVNADGKVHIVGAEGTATITATLAASGCFEQATATYTINVVDNCIDEPGTITSRDLGCDGTELTVSGHTATVSVSYQWYKDGESLGDSYTNPTCTVTVAGEYYVVVDNSVADGDHCAMASTNTIKVTAKAAATATKIVDSWYVKNGRRTPDIELVKTTNATSFTVTSGSSTIWESAGSTKTGFGGCGFHMDDNGIIYLNGTTDAGAATSGLTGDEDETLTITAIGCGGNASQNITIHKQAATTRPSIAFVVDGTKGSGFSAVSADHSTNSPLYKFLDYTAGGGGFDLTACNIYSTTDEKAIRQEYSKYDAILITDDPSTNTVPTGVSGKEAYKTKGYVNAFGTMVDVRPILTMEAYVSALANWKTKGIAGNPLSPNPRQYTLRLECKDHEIYKAGLPDPAPGTNVWDEVIGGETYRNVVLVDHTKSPYTGLADDEETAGKESPALQGFDGTASGSLLGLGRISNGSLQAAIERQEEPAARLLVFSIQAKALPNALTNEGKQIIKNILTYLLKTNMEEVDDCSNYFVGGASGDVENWFNTNNWYKKGTLPTAETKVRILAPCTVTSGTGEIAYAAQVDIATGGKSAILDGEAATGSLTIAADGALIVKGKIRTAEAPRFAANDLKPTTVNDLIINTSNTAQAALIFNNDDASTQATVNYYSLGRKIDGNYQYQYFAVPMEYVSVSPAFANENHGGTKIYTYVYHEGTGWERRGYYTDLYAFEGLGITTNSTSNHMDYTMTGTLASTATHEISLLNSGDGYNLVGNSWMAPIQISALAEDNTDANITKTAYIYCTGHDGGTGVIADTDGKEQAGQWIPVPFSASGESAWRDAGKLSVIPAMQSFQIYTAAEATLKLDYSKVVRGSTNSLNEKMRAPRRTASREGTAMSIIRVSDSKTYTDICLIEGEQFSEAFDNGWEAEYMEGDGRSAQFYAMNGEDKMAVMATDELEGTPVCFAPGKESNYTISFFGGDGHYYLNDLKEEKSTLIEQGNTYSFIYEAGDMPHRFLISTTPFGIPSVTTGCGGVEAQEKVQKVIYNDHVYIIRGGKIYDVMGKMMK